MPQVGFDYLFSYDGQLRAPLPIGGPFGDRTVFEVVDGRVWGDGVSGRVLTGGADWMLIGPDGWARLDVRAQFLLDDGTALYGAYHGLLEVNDAVQSWLADDTPTEFGDHYFRTTPRIETSNPDLRWMTQAVFVGVGRLRPNRTVEYRVYRVT